ncbi:basic proline-rich protein-like [Mustela erminea]|uniref:basic proline-rich protein-like n=1 Tax=Mustela erminea TaxID=36723 RepID=UPI001386A5FD|nr:basic proline-rich protein-like [Mustela erminea]
MASTPSLAASRTMKEGGGEGAQARAHPPPPPHGAERASASRRLGSPGRWRPGPGPVVAGPGRRAEGQNPHPPAHRGSSRGVGGWLPAQGLRLSFREPAWVLAVDLGPLAGAAPAGGVGLAAATLSAGPAPWPPVPGHCVRPEQGVCLLKAPHGSLHSTWEPRQAGQGLIVSPGTPAPRPWATELPPGPPLPTALPQPPDLQPRTAQQPRPPRSASCTPSLSPRPAPSAHAPDSPHPGRPLGLGIRISGTPPSLDAHPKCAPRSVGPPAAPPLCRTQTGVPGAGDPPGQLPGARPKGRESAALSGRASRLRGPGRWPSLGWGQRSWGVCGGGQGLDALRQAQGWGPQIREPQCCPARVAAQLH